MLEDMRFAHYCRLNHPRAEHIKNTMFGHMPT